MSIADKIRKEAIETIVGVQQVVMLTEDNRQTAEQVAKRLGIDVVYAEMLPEDKVYHMKRLKELGHNVAMVGDGINDAPAIALVDASNVSSRNWCSNGDGRCSIHG